MSEPHGQEPAPSDDVAFDGDFNPDRARSTIDRLREEVKTLKSAQQPQDEKDARAIAALRRQIDELKPQADQFRALEESMKSDTQRFAEAAETAKRDAENARAEAIRYKAAATHGISVDHFDLLGSGTEEEITTRAQKIAALVAAQNTPPATPGLAQRRPIEQMRPGATPGGVESEDDVLFAQLFGTQ